MSQVLFCGLVQVRVQSGPVVAKSMDLFTMHTSVDLGLFLGTCRIQEMKQPWLESQQSCFLCGQCKVTVAATVDGHVGIIAFVE